MTFLFPVVATFLAPVLNNTDTMDPPPAGENEGKGVMESDRSGIHEDPFSDSKPIATVGGFSALLAGTGGGLWSALKALVWFW